MFIEKEMAEEGGVDFITSKAGVSYSQWPHLEIEGHTSDDTERKRIAAFIDFPTIYINSTYPNYAECKWGGRPCRTLSFSLTYLRSTFADGSLCTRNGLFNSSPFETEAITLINQSIALSSTRERGTKITLPAAIVEECSFFVINDISRLSTEKLSFSLKPHHRVIDVRSAEGWFEMKNCVVILESGKTTALSPILSVGNGLALDETLFNSSDEASPASLSVPAIDYRPTGSKEGQLGAGPFAMSGCNLTNLTFTQTPAIVVETSGELTFSNQIFTSVSYPSTGQELRLKGSSFKQQLNPSLWTGSFSASTPELLMGEDTAMDTGHKWRESSLVYWLVSPEGEVVLDTLDEKAHDHPNCGSIEFKCNTLASAFSSSFHNTISIISLSSSTSIDVPLLIQQQFEIKSVVDTIQTVAIEGTGSFEMDKPSSTLAFTSLTFALSSLCTSVSVFIVSQGSMVYSSCTFGPSDPLSPQLSASLATLIEVKESSELNLVECSLSSVIFTHTTLGTAIHLKKGSTFTFTQTSSPFSSITSEGKGSWVLLDVKGSSEVEDAVTLLQNWAPTRTASRFTPAEKNRFVARFENGSVDELIYHWHRYDNETMHVHADGGSHEKCGLDVLPCGSLSVGLEHVGVERLIDVDGDLVETAALSAFSADTLIQSPPSTTHTLAVSKESSFVVVSCVVSFLRLSFVPFISSSSSNEDTSVRDTSLFSLTSDTLKLSSCSFSSFVLASDPLITHSDGSLSLESCCVSSVSRQSGRGSVLATTLKGGMGLSLPDLTFSSMPSTADSVAVLLSCHSIQTQSELTSFNMKNMKFGESADAATRFVEIVGNDLSKLISENDEAFTNSFNSSLSLHFLWSVDEQFELPASLLFYLLPQEGPIGVERGGLEMDRCGYNSVWCRSIEKSLERMVVQNTEVMEVRGDADLNVSLALARPLHIRGEKENATLHVDSEGSLSSSHHNTLTAEFLIVSLPATHNPLAVFISSSDLLKLNMVVITSTTPSNAQLVRISGGQAELVRLTMNAGMSTNTEVIHIASGEVHVSYLTLNSPISKNQTIVRMTDGSVNVTHVSLTTSAPVDGRLFDLSGSSIDLSSIKLTNHVFTDTPFVFSSFASASLVEVHAQNCTASHLIDAKDSDDLTLRLCSFSGPLSHVSVNDESSTLCDWEVSVLDLQNCSTHLYYTDMTCLSQGAITVREGTLTLTSCTFSSNTPPNTSFPSIRRNIQCEDGSVMVVSPSGDGDASNPNHWISAKNCSVEKETQVVAAPLFIPTLDSAGSKSVLNKSRKEYDVSVKGEMLVPCGLRVEIFEHVAVNKTSFVEGESFELIVELDESSTWNETSMEFTLPQATIADLNKKHDIRCRLVYGLEQRTDSFSLTRSGDDKKSQAGRTLSLVIPIVCTVLLAVILLIVMAVVLRRRKQKKEGVPAKELDDTANFEEEVKFDVLDNQTTANNVVHGSVEEAHQNQSMLAVSHAKSHSMNSVTEGTTRTVVAEHVMAIRCEGDNSEVAVNRADTLYRALHVTRRLDLNKALIRRQLVAGLEKVLRDEAYVELVTRLSPHWILFDESGKLMMKKSEGQTMVGNTTKESEEDRRWNAPEQEDKEKMEAGELFDVRKAAVFRLGLVLWVRVRSALGRSHLHLPVVR